MPNINPVTVEEALQYDLGSLKAGVDKSKETIEMLRQTIRNEETTISRYHEMIAILKVHKKN